jgi:hypothetical protein
MSLSSAQETIFSLNFIILSFDLIGNIFHILVFTGHKSFLKNPCVFYLIIESMVGWDQLSITSISRIDITVFIYDPMKTFLAWCISRSMIAQA